MDRLHALEAALEKIVLDPKYHDILTLVKGVRNGIVYGSKVRFPHALVMIFLFRSGSIRSKCSLVYKATRQHARNLGLFALVYKSTMLFLRHTSPTGKERHYDSFLAGLLGGYTVFGRTIHNSVSQQIVIYVAARVCLALAKLAVQPRHVGGGASGQGVKGFGTLAGGLGCFPFAYEVYPPQTDCQSKHIGLRSLPEVGNLVGPLVQAVLYG